MSHIDTPTTRTADDHRDTVARVMAAVSSRMSTGEDAAAALREVLAADGLSLVDLPEVGMWLALNQVPAEPAATSTASARPAVSIGDDGELEIDLRTLPLAERQQAAAEPPGWSRLAGDVRTLLDAAPIHLALADPARRGSAVPDPYSHPAPGAALPPDAFSLEAELASRLGAVRLLGETDLEDLRDDLDAIWGRLDGAPAATGDLVDVAPAIVLARALLDAPDGDAGNAGAAITALGLDDLAAGPSVRHLDAFDLHTAIARSVEPIVLAVADARSWGAFSAAEVARAWMLAGNVVRDAIGEHAFELLVGVPTGRDALHQIVDELDAAWTPTDDGGAWTPIGRERPPVLGAGTVGALRAAARRNTPADVAARPEIRLADDSGTPEAVLPPGGERWHLNGELLAYGAPDEPKVVALGPWRNGRWALTARAAGARSVRDTVARSWSRSDVVLVFDEHGRVHPPGLPIAGARASIVAPAGTTVRTETGGVGERRPLDDAWDGYERIDVAPLTPGTVLSVSTPSRGRAELVVERRAAARLTGRRIATIEGIHSEPAVDGAAIRVVLDTADTAADLTARRAVVTARTGRMVRRARLSEWGSPSGAASRLVDLSAFAGHTVEVSIDRPGHERVRARVALPPVVAGSGPRVEPADGWRSAPPVVATGPRAPWRRIELAADSQRLRLRARLDVDALGAPDRRWAVDPVAAARTTPWSTPEEVEQWRRWTGWDPPSGPSTEEGLAALRRLVEPLVAALDALVDHPGPLAAAWPPFGALERRQWERSIAREHAAVAAWSSRVGRGVRQWRSRDDASRNLEVLWRRSDGARRTAATGPVVDVVAAAVLAEGRGPRRVPAARLIDDLTGAAPALAAAASVFGAAYAAVQRTHPPTRFRPVDGGRT